MMSRTPFRRLLLSLALPALLAACGFEPLYGNQQKPGDAVYNEFFQTKIDTIKDRNGQLLRNELLDRLNYQGEPARPAFELKVKLDESRQDILVRSDEIATAANLTWTADYELSETVNKHVLTSGTVKSINRFNELRSPYATIASEQDARRRAARQIAEELRTRLAIYFNAHRAQTGQQR